MISQHLVWERLTKTNVSVIKIFGRLCKSNFYSSECNCCLKGLLPPSANLDLVLDAFSLCLILSRLRMFLTSETYCRESLPFLVDLTHLFWFKLLSQLTESVWLFSWPLNCPAWPKLTLAIFSNLPAPSHSLAHPAFPCV